MQETNLKISPYFDDFDRTKNYQKLLFKPGYSVQTRELNSLQSTLQNQIERFGQHVFKDGTVVIPGNINFRLDYKAVMIQSLINGISVEGYRKNLLGKTLTGTISGVKAEVLDSISELESEKDTITLYVRYTSGGVIENEVQISTFKNNEVLVDENNEAVAITTIQDSTSYTGSVAYLNAGVYFIRGFFVEVPEQKIILDQYSNRPSYKVGLQVSESISTVEEDNSLYDNAIGTSNYASPGADRLVISANLIKQNLLITEDSNFIELLRLEEGKATNIIDNSAYNELEKNLARRTFDESGSYTIKPYTVKVREALNNGSNNGVYNVNDVLPDGRTIVNQVTQESPANSFNGNEYYAVEISEGKSYVKGFEVKNDRKQYIVVEKPRNTNSINNQGLLLNIGSFFKLDNTQTLKGKITFNDTVEIRDVSDTKIGLAKVIGLTGDYRLYVSDVTVLETLSLIGTHNFQTGDFITGQTTGSTGFVDSVNGQNITLRQITGTFITGENLSGSRFNQNNLPSVSTISKSKLENSRKLVKVVNASEEFSAFIKLDEILLSGSSFTVSGGTSLTGINTKFSDELNEDSKIRLGLSEIEVDSLTQTTVTLSSSVTDGTYYTAFKLICKLYTSDYGLTSRVSNSPLKASSHYTHSKLISSLGVFIINDSGGFTIVSSGNTIDKNTIIITSGSSIVNASLNQTSSNTVEVTGTGLASGTPVNVYYKLITGNPGPGVKKKEKKSYNFLEVNKQNNSTNVVYGTRYSDKEISLKFPDVIKIHAIHQSVRDADDADAMFDKVIVNDSSNIEKGDIFTASNVTGVVLEVSSSNTLFVKYTSTNKLESGSNLAIPITFVNNSFAIGKFIRESTYGRYVDITNDFVLKRNDTEEYYRVSKIVRKSLAAEPTQKIIVVFDYFQHSHLSNDFYSVESYGSLKYSDIPISYNGISFADLIDFRYYSQPSGGAESGTISSPFVESSSTSPFDYKNSTFQSNQSVAYPSGFFNLDYEFYLGRVDKVYLTENGNGKVIKGSDSLNPSLSDDNSAGLLLATINLPPYLKDYRDATVTIERNKGYTMKDIGKLENRLSNVEQYTTLSLLESNTINMNILDEDGRNRFKNGFVVDSFSSTTVADLNNPDYTASIDLDKNLMRPYPYVANIGFTYNETESTAKKTGSTATIPYEQVSAITQPYASRVENVTPFLVSSFIGEMSISPKKDIWYDTVREITEGQSIDLTEPYRTLFDIVVPTGEIWNQWQVGGGGTRRTGGGRIRTDVRTGTSYDVNSLSFEIESGDTIESVRDVRFTRSRIIDIRTTGLKANTVFNFRINDDDANNYVYPKLLTNLSDVVGTFVVGEEVILSEIYTDEVVRPQVLSNVRATLINPATYATPSVLASSGSYVALDQVYTSDNTNLNPTPIGRRFRIIGQTSGATAVCDNPSLRSNVIGELDAFVLFPSQTFETGDINLSVSDREDGVQIKGLTSSYASGTYYSQGTQLDVTSTITTLDVPEVTANLIRQERRIFIADPPPPPPRGGGDPLAQTFSINTDGGIFATSIDLFFLTKDESIPVTLEVRTVTNGYPSIEVVPGSISVVNAGDVNTSNDASVSTRFNFQKPIYLSDKVEYAFVVKSASRNYNMWVSRLSEIDVSTGFIIDDQPNVGVLFKSANDTTWISDGYEDIKFTINRAKFDVNKTFTVVLNNKPLASNKLINNALTFTDSSAIVKVFHPNHGMHSSNNKVQISGVNSDTSNALLSTQVIGNSTSDISLLDITGLSFSPSSVEGWNTINNQIVSAGNPGFIRINEEIISYTGITNNKLTGIQRGRFNTTPVTHPINSVVECFNLNGIPLNQLNTTHNVSKVLSLDEYEITVTALANTSKRSGGTNIFATSNVQYELIYPRINLFAPSDTSSDVTFTSFTGTSIGNIDQQSFVSKGAQSLNNFSENELTEPRLVLSEPNRNTYSQGSIGTLNTIVNISTTVDNLSPEIDIDGSSIVTVSNRLNKEIDINGNIDISSELTPTGGKHSAYITKKVILENSSTSVKVMFDSIRTRNNDIKVFVKLKGDSNNGSFIDMNYVEIPSISYPTSNTNQEYRAFDFEIGGLKEFKEFSVKIVMIGNDQSDVPKIKNLRCLALAI